MTNYITNQLASIKSQQFSLGSRDAKAKEDAIIKVIPKNDLNLYDKASQVKEKYFQLQKEVSKIPMGLKILSNSPEAKDYNKILQYEQKVNNEYKNNLLKATKKQLMGLL